MYLFVSFIFGSVVQPFFANRKQYLSAENGTLKIRRQDPQI